MAPSSEKSLFTRIILIASCIAFLGGTSYSLVRMFTSPSSSTQATATEETQSITDRLIARENGYEAVLEREPNNQTALEGLLETRLQLNDLPGSIEVLEKLVTLHPEREDYNMILTALQQKIAEESQENQPADNNPADNNPDE